MLLILGLVLLFVLPSPWSFVCLGVGIALFFGELSFWNRKVRHQRSEVGTQTLVGKKATVVTACRPEGQARLEGEIWAARCEAGADIGDEVTVASVDGLTLVVAPAQKTL
jgi:membrane protein implicated in regulation of membrane protease activity